MIFEKSELKLLAILKGLEGKHLRIVEKELNSTLPTAIITVNSFIEKGLITTTKYGRKRIVHITKNGLEACDHYNKILELVKHDDIKGSH